MRLLSLAAAIAVCACSGTAPKPNGSAGASAAGASTGGTTNGGAAAVAGTTGIGGASGAGGVQNPDPDPVFTDTELATLRALSPTTLPPPPADVSNSWADNAAAAALGQRLFFDPEFSGELLDGDNDGTVNALGMKGDTGKVACAGCHVAKDGFSDTRTLHKQISLAAGWGHRRAPSLLDVGQSRLIMWDGRHDALYNQVFGPLESTLEMNSSRLYAAERIFASYKTDYEAIFGPLPPLDDTTRFPAVSPTAVGCRKLDAYNACVGTPQGIPGDGAVYDALPPADQDAVTRVWVNVGKSIAAYERKLSCGASRFDQWIAGDTTALSRAEQRGAALFAGKGNCANCHSGPFLSDEKFHDVGLQPAIVATVFIDADDPGASAGLAAAKQDPLSVQGTYSDGDDGRLPATLGPEFTGAFRTPKLRCVAGRPSFLHTGQFSTLDDVVAFFSRGGDTYGYQGTNELKPLALSLLERSDLVAFLGALTGPGPDASLLAP